MSLTPLTSPPVPPNSCNSYAMFCWEGQTDYLSTTAAQQNLITYCGNNNVNTLFLDFYSYLGGANWTSAHVASFQTLLSAAHASGIRCFALSGSPNWGTDQQWVQANIIRPIQAFNMLGMAESTAAKTGAYFDGFMFDIEYWTVGGYSAQTQVPPLMDLFRNIQLWTGLPVGAVATQWLASTTTGGQSVTYQGVTQAEGLFFVTNTNFLAVACYNNTSTTQISMLQPWVSFAAPSGGGFNQGLLCTSLTDSGQPTGESYWTGAAGAKATMNTSLAAVASNFLPSNATNSVFLGNAIEDYSSYSQMT
jgi:hypothetical protein